MKMPPDIKKFRFAILPPTIFIFSGSLLGMMVSLWLMFGGSFAFRVVAVLAALAALVSLGYSWLLAFLLPDGFSAAGVYGHSFWGRRRLISWSNMALVRRICFFNMKYLRIYAPDGKTIWLPLFQSRETEFRQEIRKFAPSDSPLLKQL